MSRPATNVLAEPTQRLDALTGLRWWAAFLVFFYHMLVFAPVPGILAQVFSYGYFGVTFFFVLSGFVLTWSARPRVSTSTFYWRRFARIWPSHMVALLLAIPVFYTFAAIPEGSFLKPFDLGILALSVVLLQAWWSNPTILFSGNPAAWTLTCEAFFYALHPWISRVLVPMAKRGALLLAGGVVLYAFVYRAGVALAPDSWLPLVPVPVQRLPEFVLGMALAWAMRSGWRPRIHPLVGVGAMAAVILAILASTRLAGTLPMIGYLGIFANELFTVACAIAIVALSAASLNGRRVFFDTKIQVKLGEWSFAFYLVHATLIYTALRIFGYQEASWVNLLWYVALFAVCVVAAWALHSFVERPAERRMRKWKDTRDAARAVPASAT
ncbi:acyltransferase [Microbacterium luteolum]|uniref:Acyltransferase n=1 Tax=Microbacterium luteolum TaxID=69367 RepID=A0ABY7XRU4_MICLT|nr:acyltransferase [Microbacterium luteolum]WDM43744.1 acyltransferase [Microbacterium luteolum]